MKARDNMTEFEKKVFDVIIKCEISTYTSCYAPERAVVTTNYIVKKLNSTKFKVRKVLKQLSAVGYIEYTSQGRPAIVSNTEDGYELICEALPPINGYALTESGFSTQQFRHELDSFNEDLRKMVED